MGNLAELATPLSSGVCNYAFPLLGEADGEKVERLPFTIRFASSEADMAKVIAVRHAGYMRHLPHLAAKLSELEHMDHEIGCSILLAESKLDGRPLGTMRIQTNRFGPLALESSVALPDDFEGLSLTEATRLAVAQEKNSNLVSTLLCKAYLMHCINTRVDRMVITARSPMDKRYEAATFKDVFPGRGYIPMQHVGDIPHRVMWLDVGMLRARWEEMGHPLFALFFRTRHPDIDLGHAENSLHFLENLDFRNDLPSPYE